MKRKKFIALLCVAATSASLVTPVMAEENQAVETVTGDSSRTGNYRSGNTSGRNGGNRVI